MVLLLRCLQVTGLLFGLCTAAHAALLVSGLGNVSGGDEVLNLLGKGLGVHPRLIGESTRFGVRTDLDDGAPRWRGYRHPSGRART